MDTNVKEFRRASCTRTGLIMVCLLELFTCILYFFWLARLWLAWLSVCINVF